LRESEAAAAPMLVTKALSQEVMVLAFVPLLLIPKNSPASVTFEKRLIKIDNPQFWDKNKPRILNKV